MAKNHDQEAKLEVGFHAVGYFDLLGQANAVANLGASHPGELSRPQLIELLKSTYARVQKFRNTFKKVLDGLAKTNTDLSRFGKLTAEQEQLLSQLVPPKTSYFGFSDSFVASVFLADFHTKVPVFGVYNLIGAAAITTLVSMARGVPVRGGIEVGFGFPLDEGDHYGKGLLDAYLLESTVADFPRIVLGPHVVNFLEKHKVRDDSGVIADVNRDIAATCLELISTDANGCAFLDYLGRGARKSIFPSDLEPNPRDLYQTSLKFIRDQVSTHKGDRKLLERYLEVQKYFERRKYLWQ